MESSQVDVLRSEFIGIRDEASAFFADALKTVGNTFEYPSGDWGRLKSEQRETAEQVRTKLTEFGHRLLEAVRSSQLLEQVDQAEMRRALRSMSASLLLKDYEYHESYVIAEEDRVYGIAPAQQRETPASAADCSKNFKEQAGQILRKMDFLAPSPENLTRAMVSSQVPGVHKYRPKTAFIMMQMD